MAKADAIEKAVNEVASLRAAGKTDATIAALRKAISHKNNLVVGKAVTVATQLGATDLADEIEHAFARFMTNPVMTDKGCVAKTSIANALYEFGRAAPDLFLAGIRHRQPEASWGKSIDTAVELRGACALAMVRTAQRDAMIELSDLLGDTEPAARIAAARAIAYTGREDGCWPLRVKALLGDLEPQVTAECLSALIKLAPRTSIPFVDRFVDHVDDQVRESALIALGESRQEAACDTLIGRWERTFDVERRTSLLGALALLRLPRAIDFMLAIIRAGHPRTAMAALDAMKPYRHDSNVRERVAAAVAETGQAELKSAFDRAYDSR